MKKNDEKDKNKIETYNLTIEVNVKQIMTSYFELEVEIYNTMKEEDLKKTEFD